MLGFLEEGVSRVERGREGERTAQAYVGVFTV